MPASLFRGAGMSIRKFCRVCDVELIPGGNWSEGVLKSRTYLCRKCNSEKGKRHYQDNQERAARLQRERLKQPKQAKQSSEYKNKYYSRNKDRWEKYRVTQKEKEKTDTWHRAGRLITWIRARAGKKSLEFDLDREWVEQKLSIGACEMTGIEFDLGKEDGERFNPWGPSIDRKDSSKGYTKDNCRMVVWIYNMAKAGWSDDVVMKFAEELRKKSQQRT